MYKKFLVVFSLSLFRERLEEDRKSYRKDSWPFKGLSSFLRSGAVIVAQKHFLGGEIKIHLASLRL